MKASETWLRITATDIDGTTDYGIMSLHQLIQRTSNPIEAGANGLMLYRDLKLDILDIEIVNPEVYTTTTLLGKLIIGEEPRRLK